MKTLLISLLFISSFAEAARFVVEAKHTLSSKEISLSKAMKIEAFAAISHPYFSRLYTVSGNVSKEDILKEKWVLNVEDTISLTRLSLEPSQKPDRIVSDELLPYQWALLNQGQTYVREKDDIHNIPLIGVTGKDIGWKNIYNKIPSKRTIVAVLDSGVDLSHPDLQGNLWRNENECGKDLSIDNDKNTLVGDCQGWDFTEEATSERAKVPSDNDGHGSHVAGIIAAAQNGVGIVGVNPNALIMPVKVMKDADSKSDIAPSQSFAQGIIYATNMGAHIINLSLGWPRSLETKHLREAVSYALSQNVILVAAAGNNNSSEPLFPCAYDGVICAAASTLDGKFAGFSNYGGHVDAVTPGEGILSLNPTLFEPEFFSIPGYDIKSGTSQSAPLLAGMVSILKAQNPELTIDDVFARIYASAQNPDKKKFIMGGAMTWESLAKEVSSPIIRPVLKRVRQLVITGEKTESRLIIPVRNFGLDTTGIKVKVESLSSGIEFSSEEQHIDALKTSEVRDLNFPVKVLSFHAESSIQIKVTITSAEGELSYLNDIPVVRDVRSEASFKKSVFKFSGPALSLGLVEDGKVVSALNPLSSYGRSKVAQFYTRKTSKKDKTLEISIFSRSENTVQEAPLKLNFTDFIVLENLIRVDLNGDGIEDYLVQTVHEDKDGQYYRFSFFNKSMKPLWEKFPSARVTIDLAIKKFSKLALVKMNHAELGNILVPAFFVEGQIPKIDQNQDFFQRWDGSKELRLYYLEPMVSDLKLRIRTLTTNKWEDELKKQLNAKWSDTVMIENILPVSVSDAEKGEVRLILSVGQGTKRQIFISTFSALKTSMGRALPQIVLQTEGVDSLLSVSEAGLDSVGDTFLNVYDRSRAKIVTTKDAAQSSQLNYNHVSETDLIAGHIVSFENGNKRLSVLQTRDELVSLSTVNGVVTQTKRPKLRYSFFSSKVLSEMYRPVIFKREGVQAPALFVDSTAVTANRIYLFEEQGGKLVSSIKNSLIVPANCKALDPAFSAESGSHEFVFLCLEDKEWALRTYKMN